MVERQICKEECTHWVSSVAYPTVFGWKPPWLSRRKDAIEQVLTIISVCRDGRKPSFFYTLPGTSRTGIKSTTGRGAYSPGKYHRKQSEVFMEKL